MKISRQKVEATKRGRSVLISCLLLFFLVACNQEDTTQNEYYIYGSHENLDDEMRESLLKCLNKEKIDYKVDSEKNVLIKKKADEKAVIKCS